MAYAHGGGTLEHLDVVYCGHPRQGGGLPEGMPLIAHPVCQDDGLVEATQEEHVEASVVLDRIDARDVTHGLRRIGEAHQLDLLQREDVGRQGHLALRCRDLEDGVGGVDTCPVYDDLAQHLCAVEGAF